MNNKAKNLKISVSVLVVIIILIATTNLVYAGAYEWGGLGTRAQSMGGAFIGLANDWTAIYWNPAGLAQLEGNGWGIDFLSPHPIIKDGNSLSNLLPTNMETKYRIDTFAQYNGQEPTKFNKDEVRYHFYNPNGLGGYWRVKDFTIGAGIYTPVAYYFDWEDTISYGSGTINAELYQRLVLSCFNISVAKEVHPKFSLGMAFELIWGSIDYDADKTVSNSGISDYTWDQESKSEGTGFEGIFGVLFKLTDELSLGGVYRTGSTVELEGEADTHLSLTGLLESSDFTQKFPYPSTWGLGLAYKPKPNLTLTCDWQRTNWSEFKIDVNYEREGSALTDKDYSADWKDSNRFRFGLEYKPIKNWALRAGYFFDESPLPDKSVSFSNVADVDRHNILLGVGYQWKNNWQLDFLYAYAWGERTANNVVYEQRINAFGITGAHKF